MSDQLCDILYCCFKVKGSCTKTEEGYLNCQIVKRLSSYHNNPITSLQQKDDKEKKT